jgi:hypothetical protein
MKKYILLLLVAVAGITGCETEIDLNADYKQIPVIYGLLEENKDIQIIKINRSFLGETNALIAAQNPDSTFYSNISPVIEKLNEGIVVDSRSLRDTVLADREPGDFYTSPNKYYFFHSTDEFLDEGFEYRLIFEANGEEIFAESVLLESFEPSRPASSQSEVSLVRNDAINQGFVEFKSFPIKLTTQENARLYDNTLSVKYTTKLRNGETIDNEVTISLPDIEAKSLLGGELAETSILGEKIFNGIASEVGVENVNEEDVIFRELGQVEVSIVSITDDFNTYLESIAPSTGVVLEKPQFTNINFGEDGLGIGIFTSRNSFRKEYKLDSKTIKGLAVFPATMASKFCSFEAIVRGVQRVDCREFN